MPARETRSRSPLAIKLLAVPVVVIVLLVGIWLAGGVITNDFGVAMALTVVWMGIAGLACLAVAWRWRGSVSR
jgi:hypothetical protein